jgi:hypothetical protein
MKRLKEQMKDKKDIEVPWRVWTKFGETAKYITVHGDQASLTSAADFGNIKELQVAIEWYVDQLGGVVNWEE